MKEDICILNVGSIKNLNIKHFENFLNILDPIYNIYIFNVISKEKFHIFGASSNKSYDDILYSFDNLLNKRNIFFKTIFYDSLHDLNIEDYPGICKYIDNDTCKNKKIYKNNSACYQVFLELLAFNLIENIEFTKKKKFTKFIKIRPDLIYNKGFKSFIEKTNVTLDKHLQIWDLFYITNRENMLILIKKINYYTNINEHDHLEIDFKMIREKYYTLKLNYLLSGYAQNFGQYIAHFLNEIILIDNNKTFQIINPADIITLDRGL